MTESHRQFFGLAGTAMEVVRLDDEPGRPVFAARRRLLDPNAPYPASARLVGLAMLEHVNYRPDSDGNYSCWPSNRTIAGETRLSTSTVKRHKRDWLCGGPCPLFRQVPASETVRNGWVFVHASDRYEVVPGLE